MFTAHTLGTKKQGFGLAFPSLLVLHRAGAHCLVGLRPRAAKRLRAVTENSRIRDMLYLHRGPPLMHRIKAIFW